MIFFSLAPAGCSQEVFTFPGRRYWGVGGGGVSRGASGETLAGVDSGDSGVFSLLDSECPQELLLILRHQPQGMTLAGLVYEIQYQTIEAKKTLTLY